MKILQILYMSMKFNPKYLMALLSAVIIFNCKNNQPTNGKPNIVTTTTMITDLVKNIGGGKNKCSRFNGFWCRPSFI